MRFSVSSRNKYEDVIISIANQRELTDKRNFGRLSTKFLNALKDKNSTFFEKQGCYSKQIAMIFTTI